MAGGLPDAVRAALREAFASEVASRLPRMQRAAAQLLATGAADAGRSLFSHAHTLASSAAILGEDRAAVHARRCADLLDGVRGADVPRPVAVAAAGEVEMMSLLLSAWLAA